MINSVQDAMRNLHQRPIAVYPAHIKMVGSLAGGVMLSQLMYWFSKKDKFYKTNEDIMLETALSEGELKSAKRAIKSLSFISVTIEGLPAKTYYQLDWSDYLNQLGEIDPTSRVKLTQHSKTTTEITSEKEKEREEAFSCKNNNSQISEPSPIGGHFTESQLGPMSRKVKQEKENIARKEKDDEDTANANEVMRLWNVMAVRMGLSKCLAMNGNRKRMVIDRIREHGMDAWKRVFCAVQDSDFLTKLKKPRVDIGWLSQPEWFLNTLENRYVNTNHDATSDGKALVGLSEVIQQVRNGLNREKDAIPEGQTALLGDYRRLD